MISQDQPTCFPDDILVAVSSKSSGTMLDRAIGIHDGSIVSNRTKFCDRIGVSYGDAVYQRIIYGDNRSYDLICEVDDGSTTKYTSEVVADALFTKSKNVALMLPVADCVATVIYDPVNRSLALVHLGRHSTVVNLLERVIDKFTHEGSDPRSLIVWMSPSAQSPDYVMEYFDQADEPAWQNFCQRSEQGIQLDLQGYNANICLQAGLLHQNIHTSSINTITSGNYFSHFTGDAHGRFAVVAVMR